MAAVLKQAYEEYQDNRECPKWCSMFDTCEHKQSDRKACDAKNFIHSAWAASMCDGVDVDYSAYVLRATTKYRLSKNTARYVEGELKNYHYTKRMIERQSNEIINSTPAPQEGHGSEPGDPTAAKVTQLLKANELERMKRTVKAIDKIYNSCTRDMRMLIEERYWKNRYTDQGVAELLHVSEKTCYNWRQKIIIAIAIELKYL